jgi:hypothetical protein
VGDLLALLLLALLYEGPVWPTGLELEIFGSVIITFTFPTGFPGSPVKTSQPFDNQKCKPLMINKSGLMLKDYKKFAGRRREKAARGYDKIFTVFYMLDRVYAGNYGLSMINPQ